MTYTLPSDLSLTVAEALDFGLPRLVIVTPAGGLMMNESMESPPLDDSFLIVIAIGETPSALTSRLYFPFEEPCPDAGNVRSERATTTSPAKAVADEIHLMSPEDIVRIARRVADAVVLAQAIEGRQSMLRPRPCKG